MRYRLAALPVMGWLALAGAVGIAVLAAAPWMWRTYWERRSSNAVRRGVRLAGELGCFSCHGSRGEAGIPDPGSGAPRVPRWTGGEWTAYVLDAADVSAIILDGSIPESGARVPMPAYQDRISAGELDDLVAAFTVMAGMVLPPPGSGARRGLDLARTWRCFACHGPGASGGEPNPGSFTGFIPGWYGPDFRELVRSRVEFDEWIRTGSLARLEEGRISRRFLRRQRTPMPAYDTLTPEDLDDLWGYAVWLEETGGGVQRLESSPGPALD